jgi:hypothetical protein
MLFFSFLIQIRPLFNNGAKPGNITTKQPDLDVLHGKQGLELLYAPRYGAGLVRAGIG